MRTERPSASSRQWPWGGCGLPSCCMIGSPAPGRRKKRTVRPSRSSRTLAGRGPSSVPFNVPGAISRRPSSRPRGISPTTKRLRNFRMTPRSCSSSWRLGERRESAACPVEFALPGAARTLGGRVAHLPWGGAERRRGDPGDRHRRGQADHRPPGSAAPSGDPGGRKGRGLPLPHRGATRTRRKFALTPCPSPGGRGE